MSIRLSPDKYRHHLKPYNYTTEQEDEMLKALWKIMGAFSDRAFKQHPAQQVNPSSMHKFAFTESDKVESE